MVVEGQPGNGSSSVVASQGCTNLTQPSSSKLRAARLANRHCLKQLSIDDTALNKNKIADFRPAIAAKEA